MKHRKYLSSTLVLVFLLAACAGTPAPAATQPPTVAPVATQPSATSTSTPAPTPTYQPATVTINDNHRASFAPIYIAVAEGYFAEYGITVEYVDLVKNEQAIPLVDSGELDAFVGFNNAGLLNTIAQGGKVKVVADRGHLGEDMDCAYMALLIRKDLLDSGAVKGPADLKGKTISAGTTSSSGFLLSTYLKEANLGFSDLNINKIPSSGYVDALVNKSLDGLIAEEPDVTAVLSSGNAEILASSVDVLGFEQYGVLGFGKRLLSDDRELGVRFLAAYLKGVQKYNEGKTDRNVQILSEALGVDADTVKNQCWLAMSGDGKIFFEGVDPFQQWALTTGDMDQAVTEEQFWDPTLLQDALKLLDQ